MNYREASRRLGRVFCWLAVAPLVIFLSSLPPVPLLHASTVAGEPGDPIPPGTAPSAFTFDDVNDVARGLALGPFTPAAEASDFLRALGREQWRGLLYDEDLDRNRHADAASRLIPGLLLPGYILTKTLAINIIDDDGVRPIVCRPEKIRAGDKELAERLAAAPTGFAGLSFQADGQPEGGVMSASHFQFVGRNARPGVFAQPLMLVTGEQSADSRPVFRELWLRKPRDDDDNLVVYALMDSPAATGAFEFTILPGTSTVVDVRAAFHSRPAAGAGHSGFGIAPITGMFLFSETVGNAADYRPEVHNCDGLLAAAGDGRWLWSCLKNPGRLTVSDISLPSPRGFGLVQRDANFDHYQDLHNRFERSTSVWVEPKGDWGPGRLELVELPGSRDFHSNIMAYWISEKPAADAAPGQDAAPTAGIEYRLYWMPPGLPMHDLGMVRDTRMERSQEDRTVTFHIDFAGGGLEGLPPDTGLTSVVELSKEATLLEKRLMKNDVTGGWRLTVKISLPAGGVLDSILSARSGPRQVHVSAYLKKGENLDEPLTETWRYGIIP